MPTNRRTATTTMLLAASAGAASLVLPNAVSAQEVPEEETTTTAVEETTTTTAAPVTTTTVVEVADPAAPVISEVTALFEALSIEWAAPEASDPIAYHLMAIDGEDVAAQQIVSADVHQASLAGLENGTEYEVVVLPYDEDGPGVASEPVSGTPDEEADEAGAAAEITGLAAKKGLGFATVEWDAPANDGGSPIVGYSVVAIDQQGDSLVAWRNVRADLRNASISGLQGGHTYDLYVLAVTAAGFGEVADPVSVTPSSSSTVLPQAPTMTWATAVPAGDTAIVSFGAAFERGSATTKYHVVVIQDEEMTAWKAVDADQRQVAVPLGENGPADIYVFAESASGFGPFLETLTVEHAPAEEAD